MKIGRYEIKGLLGRGGMGAVYKAAMPVTGRMVALKVCKPAEILEDIIGEERILEMFITEAVTMARIEHPNIAAVLDVSTGSENDPPHFVMEYFCNDLGTIIGETYEVERPSRVLDPDTALEYARQMARGLERLHHAGIIHRDVKPFNVMLAQGPDGHDTVKLIDFGLSKLRGEPFQGHKGMVVGSPYYSAPEQERNPNEADERSDMYSVGVTLYRMLTGRLPGQEHDATLPEGEFWQEFFDTALANDPKNRFADAAAFLAALESVAEAWETAKAETCAFYEPDETRGPCDSTRPRSEPLKILKKHARKTFRLDAIWRPETPCESSFAAHANGTVRDAATGLVWEQGGTRYPCTRAEAVDHVEMLNETAFGGCTRWRLPTVDELCTLLGPANDPAAYCLEPAFDRSMGRLWSCDRRGFNSGWYADARRGFIWWADDTCPMYARAVTDCFEQSGK